MGELSSSDLNNNMGKRMAFTKVYAVMTVLYIKIKYINSLHALFYGKLCTTFILYFGQVSFFLSEKTTVKCN